MKYEKAKAEVVRFEKTEFLAGSGNWDGGYCKNYSHGGRTCGYVTPCSEYGLTIITCGSWFECDSYSFTGWIYTDRGFRCDDFV